MIRRLFPVFIAVLAFAACNAQDKDGQEEATAATAAKRDSTEITFPVYSSFAQLEPIFQQKNDTTYVINFWATWCKPCVEELPYFEALHEEFAGEKLKVILVSLDFKKDIDSKLIPFVQKWQLKSQVIALTDGKYNTWIDKVDPNWGGAIPVTVVYNAEARKFFGEQFPGPDALNTVVREML